MSEKLVPSKHRLEYVIYLTLTLPWITLLSLVIPFVDQTVFILTGSTILALVLFLERIDKRIDPKIAKRIKEHSNISEFYGNVLIFLRIWEIYPLALDEFDSYINNQVTSVVQGEEIHDEVWLLKLIMFLVPTFLGTILLLVPTIESIDILILETFLVNIQLSGLLVALSFWGILAFYMAHLWNLRVKETSSRGNEIVKYRVFKDLLQREKSLRQVQEQTDAKPRFPDDDMVWNKDSEREFKDSVLTLVDAIDRSILRREWERLTAFVSDINSVVLKTREEFLQIVGYGFTVLAASEAILPPDGTTPSFAKIRYCNLVKCVQTYFTEDNRHVDDSLKRFITELGTHDIKPLRLLKLCDLSRLTQKVTSSIGTMLTKNTRKIIADKSMPESFLPHLNGSPNTLKCILGVLRYVNPFSRDAVFGAMRGHIDEIVSNIINCHQYLDLRTKPIAYELLGEFGEESELHDQVVDLLCDNIRAGGYDLGRPALDSLCRLGAQTLRTGKALETIKWALNNGIMFPFVLHLLTLMKDDVALIEALNRDLMRYIPNQNTFVESIIVKLLDETDLKTDEPGSLFLNIAIEKLKITDSSFNIDMTDDTRLSNIEKRVCSSDPKDALRCISRLRQHPEKWIEEDEMLNALIDCLSKGSGVVDVIRYAIYGLFQLRGKSIPLSKDQLNEILENSKGARTTLFIAGSVISNSQTDLDGFITEHIRERPELVSCVVALTESLPSHDIISAIVDKVGSSSADDSSYALFALSRIGRDLLDIDKSLDKLQDCLRSLNHPELILFTLLVLEDIEDSQVERFLAEKANELDYWLQRRLAERAGGFLVNDFIQ